MKIKVQHKKGKHNASLWTKLKLAFVLYACRSISIEFTEKSKYDLKDQDQYDWCKVIGAAGFLYDIKKGVHKNEQFVVWRYHLKDDIFEVCPAYWRKNYEFDYDRKNIVRMKPGDRKAFDITFIKSLIPKSSYFGGNEVAPSDIEYYIHATF